MKKERRLRYFKYHALNTLVIIYLNKTNCDYPNRSLPLSVVSSLGKKLIEDIKRFSSVRIIIIGRMVPKRSEKVSLRNNLLILDICIIFTETGQEHN